MNASYQKLTLNHFYDVTAPDATHDNLGPQPRGQRIFYRSDHYNFAKMGIPIAFFTTGLHPDYHRATDTPDKIDYKQMQVVSKTMGAGGSRPATKRICEYCFASERRKRPAAPAWPGCPLYEYSGDKRALPAQDEHVRPL